MAITRLEGVQNPNIDVIYGSTIAVFQGSINAWLSSHTSNVIYDVDYMISLSPWLATVMIVWK